MCDPQDKLDVKTLALFQLKDFCGTDIDKEENFSENIKEAAFSNSDALKAMDKR